ncbi:2985_t:CDS:2 [Cetraspora pellucida]|uniref:2985_t:CDS:1 n=1 Tax=Cetraspora pellucida TaxID=1433469 RepID=A0ACA9KJV8_9GLOM|nr:2985_t:CDS:2 [Cetraspora pellucida]
MADANEPVTRSNEDNSSSDMAIHADTHETEPTQDPPSVISSDIPTTLENSTQQPDSSAPPADFQPLPPQLPRWMNPTPKLHVPERSDYSHLEFDWKVDPSSYLRPIDNTFVDYNVLLDGHSHTTYSDGRMKPEQLLQWAIANGYNAIVVSDHNTIEGALKAQKIANEKYKGLITVIPGMEYRIHMQFIGIQSNPFGPFNKPFPTNEELKALIDKVHKMGGLVTVNHIPWSNKTEWGYDVPTLLDHPTRDELYEMGVDGFEIINGNVFDHETYVFAKNHKSLAISGSDVHFPSEGAYAWTLLKAGNKTVEGIMSALRGKATSFLFDATGTRPRYYPADNKEYFALLPITALANVFASFYDDYRGMYSFQGGFCHERKIVVHWISYWYFILYCLLFFIIYELLRKAVKSMFARYKKFRNDRGGHWRRLDVDEPNPYNREHYTDFIDMEP